MNVRQSDLVQKFRFFGCPTSRSSYFIHRRSYSVKEGSQVAIFYIIAGAFDSAAFSVAQYQNQPGTCKCRCIFQTSQYTLGNHITSNPDAEYISQSLIKYQLRAGPAVHAA